MILINTGLVFEQDMIGRRSQSVLFFCFSLPQIPRGREDKIEYLSFQCQSATCRRGKRESGANPERSGHCKRGDGCKMSLCLLHEKAQPRSMIRKSGNLLKYSVHSFRRKRFALMSHSWLSFEFVKRRLLFRKERQASFFACRKRTAKQHFGR